MEALDIIFYFRVLIYKLKRQTSRDIRSKDIKSLCLKPSVVFTFGKYALCYQ